MGHNYQHRSACGSLTEPISTNTTICQPERSEAAPHAYALSISVQPVKIRVLLLDVDRSAGLGQLGLGRVGLLLADGFLDRLRRALD